MQNSFADRIQTDRKQMHKKFFNCEASNFAETLQMPSMFKCIAIFRKPYWENEMQMEL